MNDLTMPLIFSGLLLFCAIGIAAAHKFLAGFPGIRGGFCWGFVSLGVGLFLSLYRYTNLPLTYEQHKQTDEWGRILIGIAALVFLVSLAFWLVGSRQRKTVVKEDAVVGESQGNSRLGQRIICVALLLCLVGSGLYLRPRQLNHLERYLGKELVLVRNVGCNDERMIAELGLASLELDYAPTRLENAQRVLRYCAAKTVRKTTLHWSDVELTPLLYADVINKRKALNISLCEGSDGEQYLLVAEISPVSGSTYSGIELDNDMVYYRVVN